jgi:hypothetical protein
MPKKYLQKLGAILLATLISFVMFANVVVAQDPAAETTTPSSMSSFNVKNYLTVNSNRQEQVQKYLCEDCNPVAIFLIQVANFLAMTIGSVCFLAIIIGGFFILTSAGNETNMNKGKEIITYAVIGLVISLSAYFIVAFVQSILFEI